MRIWLVTIGEPLPTDGTGDRLHRTGILAQTLAARNHQVLWWTSAFDHARKRHRVGDDAVVDVCANLRIWMMRSRGYRSNVSLGRMLDHVGLARGFARSARKQAPPDVIVAAMPTPGLALACANYGRAKGVPVIVDMRDMWPDIFVRAVPRALAFLARPAIWPMRRTLRLAASRATAIIGITEPFVEWGLSFARRPRRPTDRDFALGYSRQTPPQDALDKAQEFWRSLGVGPRDDAFTACFFGYFGRQFELQTVIDAARTLQASDRKFRFVLCGSGDNFDRYRRLAGGLTNVVFPGWVGSAGIWSLMRMSSVGLAPYISNADFQASIPNKAVEYMSAGLPIASSLTGTLQKLLADNDCGLTYGNGKPAELADALRLMHDSPDRLKAMSANALALFERRFVAEKVYGEMADYIERIAKENQCPDEPR